MPGESGEGDARWARKPWFIGAACLAIMTGGTSWQFLIGSLSPFIVPALGLSAAGLGMLGSIFYVVGAVASPLVGRMADVLTPRRSGLVLSSLTAAGILSVAGAHGWSLLILGCVAGGIGMAGVNPLTNGIIANNVHPSRRVPLIGLKQSGVPLCAGLAGICLPLVAAGTSSWRWAAVTALALPAIMLLTVLVVPMAGPSGTPRYEPVLTATRSAVKPPQVLRLTIYSGIMGSSVSLINVYLPLFAYTEVGLSATHAGMLTGVVGISGVIARNTWSLLLRKHAGAQNVFRLQALGGAVTALMLVLAPWIGTWSLWCAAVFAGGTIIASNAVLMLAVVQMASTSAVGHVSGQIQRGFFIGIATAPLLIGPAVDAFGSFVSAWAWVCLACLTLALVVRFEPRGSI